MALTPPPGTGETAGPARPPTPASTGARPASPPVPASVIDPRRTVPYRLARVVFISSLRAWFRPAITGLRRIPAQGPVILAPVHRSFADFGFCGVVTRRKLFFMAKDELWRNRWLGRLLVGLGAFPVHREAADREALRRAQTVLERGQVLVMFPEGTRREGPDVTDLHEGAAFLAARTGAVIVPIGIGGSDAAMPKGARIPRRLRIRVVVGEPLPAPARTESGRVRRSELTAATERLRAAVQAVYDEARSAFDAG